MRYVFRERLSSHFFRKIVCSSVSLFTTHSRKNNREEDSYLAFFLCRISNRLLTSLCPSLLPPPLFPPLSISISLWNLSCSKLIMGVTFALDKTYFQSTEWKFFLLPSSKWKLFRGEFLTSANSNRSHELLTSSFSIPFSYFPLPSPQWFPPVNWFSI